LVVQLICELAALVYLFWVLKVHLRRSPSPSSARIGGWQMAKFGGLSHLGTMLMQLNYRIDLFLVNMFLGPSVTGVYFIAVRIAEQLWIVSQSMSAVLLPTLSSRSSAEFEPDDVAPRSIRMALYSGIALALALFFVVRPALSFVFGHAYDDAGGVMALLLPGALLLGGARVACVSMTARGRPELNIYVSVAIFLVNIVLNLLLIPVWGTRGAALATSTSYCVGSVIALWLLGRLANKSWTGLLAPTRRDLDLLRVAFLRLRGRGPDSPSGPC
jgi:O-antigen/teichoic acid export membrane protein